MQDFYKIKPSSLKDIIGIDLEFKEIAVEAGHSLDPRDKDTYKYINPKDYYSHTCSYFTEKTATHLTEFYQNNLEEIFKDKIVVDLGSSCTPYAYLTAINSGAKAYIGVDFTKELRLLPTNASALLANHDMIDKQIPLVMVQTEMLSFLDASIRANQKYSFICSSYGNYPKDTSLFSINFFDILRELLPKTTDSKGGILAISTDLQMPEFDKIKKQELYDISFLKLKN